MTRGAMWFLLTVVAAAAAVLSWASLRDLAGLCGFTPGLAWLLPVVVDAGAAAGATIWLAHDPAPTARGYARTLTVSLLTASVLGNGVVHYLTAYALRPAWWLVVAVSAVAPSVLGAVVHLSVLVGRDSQTAAGVEAPPAPAPAAPHPVSVPERTDSTSRPQPAATPTDGDLVAATRELLPISRRKLAAELGVSEHTAKGLLAQAQTTTRMRVLA